MKSEPTLSDFVSFCSKNPELRFWQALSAFTRKQILAFPYDAPAPDDVTTEFFVKYDTFYREGV